MPALVLNSTPRLGHAESVNPLVLLLQHAGGSTNIMVNQQQPGAGWFRLGAFGMNPGQNH